MTKPKLLDAIQDAASRKPESCERIEKSNDCELIYYGKEIKTVEQLLADQNIDMDIWRIVSQTINGWEVTGKKSKGQDAGGKWQGETLWKTTNTQIKVKLERRAPESIQKSIQELIKNVKPIATCRPPRRAKSGRHMAEVALYDHHFGKLCWGQETGHNYDLNIAELEFQTAVDELLAKVDGFNVERIVLPIGNDFFHSNDFHSQTANLTQVESVDDRFSKVFRIGCRASQYAIERCLAIAPVDVIFVPGNHDRHTAWFMVEWLAALFHKNKHVSIDNGPRERKYVTYGPALIGYTHGEVIPHNNLPTLMATEQPALWASHPSRHWRLGHLHKRKEVRHTVSDMFNGVEVRIFPSLSGTDAFHYKHGYVGTPRMAEVHLWSETTGPSGYFISHAKEPAVA